MDENTKIHEMEITDEFYMVGSDYTGDIVAKHLQQLSDDGVVLVAKGESSEVIGYITYKEIVDSFAEGKNPHDILASDMMNTDFMEVMYDDTLGTILPQLSEQYPNAVVVINFERECVGFFSKNDYKDALAALGYYDKTHEPETPEEWRTQGIAMSSMGQVSEALQCYEKSLVLFPNKEQAWFDLARSFEHSNRLKDAIICYDRVVDINPNNDDAWMNRGNIYAIMRLPDRAIQSYNHAVTLNPENYGAIINMGLAYSDLGNVDKAIACYQNAEALKGESAELWYRKGNAYDKAEKRKEAIECYDKAIKLNPHYENAWFNKAPRSI